MLVDKRAYTFVAMMKREHTDRSFERRSPGRARLRKMMHDHVRHPSLCVIISLLAVGVSFPGCEGTPLIEQESGDKPEQPLPQAADTVRIVVNKSAGSTITRTDLFVFTAAGQQECHLCFTDSSDTHRAALTQGEKQIVAIVNSPYILNGQSTSKIESLEQLVFQFKDDSPGHPAMSGSTTCVISPGTVSVEVPITQLMCSVVLTDISNNLTHYRLLENPRISLTAINPEAEIMRVNGFRPSGMARDGEAVALPCDVGFYTQYPGTVLHCYPDETPDAKPRKDGMIKYVE